MRSSLEQFRADRRDLERFVESIGEVRSVLMSDSRESVREYESTRRKFDGAAFLVALYSSFERFVEGVVEDYARALSRHCSYGDLPSQLRNKHTKESADILSKHRVGRGRYKATTALEVVQNLFDCISGSSAYALNEKALSNHDSNLRRAQVDDVFKGVGIDSATLRACRMLPLKEWFGDRSPEQGREALERHLDDLVERRNEVAHRWGQAPVLGAQDMSSHLAFVDGLVESLFLLAAGKYLGARYSEGREGSQSLSLERPPLEKGRVVVLKAPERRVFIGQAVFAVTSQGNTQFGRIESIRVNDEPVKEVSQTSESVGVRLDFLFPGRKTSTKLIALSKPDELVWGE